MSTYVKQVDPETQSLLSQQSITLTDSTDLKNLALRHFVQSEPERTPDPQVEPEPVLNTESVPEPTKPVAPTRSSKSKSPRFEFG